MKAKFNIVVAILSIILLQGWYNEIYCQIKFASSQLEQLALQTGITIPDKDGICYREVQYNDLPLTIIVKHGEVTHIGLSLFTTDQRKFIDELICNFLERTALAAEIPDFYGIAFSQYLKDQKIEVFDGRWDNLKTLLSDSCCIFQSTLIDSKSYFNCWYSHDATERFLTIAFPADFHLISGLSMIEAENRLYDDILLTRVADTTFVEPDSVLLQRIGNSSIYLLRGDIYYLPGLNSNRYYVADSLGKFDLFVSRTGYTGEDGFELLVKNADAVDLWDEILKQGKEFGLQPIGLGARDTLRLEAALHLYGNDMASAHVVGLINISHTASGDEKIDQVSTVK